MFDLGKYLLAQGKHFVLRKTCILRKFIRYFKNRTLIVGVFLSLLILQVDSRKSFTLFTNQGLWAFDISKQRRASVGSGNSRSSEDDRTLSLESCK